METSSSTTKANKEIECDNSKHKKVNLPEEIITDIISRLPVKPVFQLQCLSKNFSSITKNRSFIEAHLKHSALLHPSIIVNSYNNFYLIRSSGINSKFTAEKVPLPKINGLTRNSETFRIVGSCNGLVVFASAIAGVDCFLLNPSTSICDGLPHPARNMELADWGFGFCAESKVYKVVRIAVNFNSMGKSSVLAEVLTYGTDSVWRKLDFSKFGNKCYGNGVTVKGLVYWKPSEILIQNKLLTFNLEKEEFAWIFSPVSDVGKLLEFKGSLALCVKSTISKMEFDFWVLKEEVQYTDGGVCHAINENSWEKLYTTGKLRLSRPVLCVKDFQLLLHKNSVHPLSFYDLQSKKFKGIISLSNSECDFKAFNFVESIVPLRATCELITTHMASINFF